MKEEEKAYIAGIIDGEGSITLTRFHKNQYPSPCVSVSSTTIELLEYLKSLIGKGKINKKKNYNKEKHKDSFTYSINYNNAIDLLENIQPYLIIKQKKLRAILIIEKYKLVTPRNGRYSNEMKKLKEEFYKEFMTL